MREKGAQQIEAEAVKELQIRMMMVSEEPNDEIMSPDIIQGY